MIPTGVWAVASGLRSADEARDWAKTAASAHAFTFRRPACSEREAIAALRVLRRHTRFLAVHGRGDWAAAAEADAVIATFDSLPVTELRRLWPQLRVGASTHDLAEVQAAREAGASFLLFGPIHDTPSKHGILEPRGLEALRESCQMGTPVIAIGGIQTPAQAATCRQCGSAGVAVLRAARSAALLERLQSGWAQAPS